MNDFEIRASNIATALEIARERIDEFGYEEDPTVESVSRIYGMFVTWLTACEEARHQMKSAGASFAKNVIEALPMQDDPAWRPYIIPSPISTLRERAQALWGVRIAFTHGDGEITLITNPTNQAYAMNAPNHLPGVSVVGNRLVLHSGIVHTAVRTVVQLREVIP